MSARLFLLGLTTLLCSCGWQLQGSGHLSEVMAVTYIDTPDRYSDFNRALSDRLRASGARLANNRRDATAIVRILDDVTGQRVLAVSARNTPEEYEVFYSIRYSVSNQIGEIIEPQYVELTREYSYDETAVLAKQKEQGILREALARDLAALVVRQLGAIDKDEVK
jgi:LPS-assembly lipoprotein